MYKTQKLTNMHEYNQAMMSEVHRGLQATRLVELSEFAVTRIICRIWSYTGLLWVVHVSMSCMHTNSRVVYVYIYVHVHVESVCMLYIPSPEY